MGQNITLVAQFGAPTFTSLRTLGNTTVGNNLTVSGSITAQSLVVNTTSIYSGSTRFGTIVSDTHQFTGSIFTSGSITVIGQYNGSGAGLTSIPNSALSSNTISGISLGSNLATLTIGTGLSGTSYNGSGAVTIANTGVTSNVAGTGITVSGATGAVTITNSDRGSSQNIFKNIAVSGQSTVVADGNDDTLTLAGAGATTITTNASTDTITISSVNTTYSVGDGGLTAINFTTTRRDKLDGIAAGATNVTNNNQLTNGAGYITSAGTAAAINQTVAVDTNANLVYSQMGSNDFFRIRVGGASNAGYAEIATADDGTEPIYVRQYTGVFSDVTRTATLLDGSGNTSFPGNISGAYILGSYFNASAGNSENPTIGQIWTQNTTDNYLRKSTPAHLISQLGLITTSNYSSYALPLSGGTISGNVTINGSSNIPLTINEPEPYVHINATGNTNTAGIRIYPSTGGYNAEIGNFRDGALNIYAKNKKMGQFRQYSVLNDLQMGEGGSTSMGSISLYLSNFENGYEGRIGGGNIDGNTHFYHRNNASSFSDVGYFNQSGFYIDVLGGPSDIRLKDIIETNPVITIDGIDVIKYTFKSNPLLTRYGYSAQQVQSVLPDLVTINSPIGGPADEGTLMLNYNDLHVLKIAALERKVAQLEADIVTLKS